MKNSPLIKSFLLVAVLLNVALIGNFLIVPALRSHLVNTIVDTTDTSYEDAIYIAEEYYPQL